MEDIEKELLIILRENCCCCGVSFQFTNIMNLKLYYEQADIALKFGNPAAGSINYCSDYIMKYLLNVIKTNSKTAIIHPSLYILKRYDEANKSELYNTLYQYLLHERNLVKTAEILSIHRNSLLYRLKKIKELVDIDMDNPSLRQYLVISFQLLGRYYENEFS
jgi:DNA-binding PucR family transcriptional regulator